VPLTEILDRAGLTLGARAVVFKGADGVADERAGAATRFDRSLNLEEVRESEVLLAYLMNGEPLPVQHGYPLRAIVPGWYGVASVKWLAEIEVVDRPLVGHFQTERYFFESERDGEVRREPIRHQRVRALITQPGSGGEVERGALSVRGFAWSGMAPIARVEVSVNEGEWQIALLSGLPSSHCWQPWEAKVQIDGPGPVRIRARAIDKAGRTQPEHPEWNRLGYGNNAVHEVAFRSRG
jgi:DMSO/TMAO reductase YedYZ molybdopterin-dependent catalytic subunit